MISFWELEIPLHSTKQASCAVSLGEHLERGILNTPPVFLLLTQLGEDKFYVRC